MILKKNDLKTRHILKCIAAHSIFKLSFPIWCFEPLKKQIKGA